MWNVHKNRFDKGKGGTYSSTGHHEFNKPEWMKDVTRFVYTQSRSSDWLMGLKPDHMLDNVYLRWKHKLAEQPASTDFNDEQFYSQDMYERAKPYEVRKDDPKLIAHNEVIPRTTNEAEPQPYNSVGMSPWSQYWDENKPMIDHGIDEDTIWNFQKTYYGENVAHNWHTSFFSSEQYEEIHNMPNWGQKMQFSEYFTKEKLAKLQRHTQYRKRLNEIKKRQAKEVQAEGLEKPGLVKSHEVELGTFIGTVHEAEKQIKLKDLYVTDHEKTQQYLT